jgi:hypothetical protein
LNFPTWRYNPQLFITVAEQKTVRLKLVQDSGKLYHIGFYVAKSDDTDKRQLLLLRDDIVAKHTFQDNQESRISLGSSSLFLFLLFLRCVCVFCEPPVWFGLHSVRLQVFLGVYSLTAPRSLCVLVLSECSPCPSFSFICVLLVGRFPLLLLFLLLLFFFFFARVRWWMLFLLTHTRR